MSVVIRNALVCNFGSEDLLPVDIRIDGDRITELGDGVSSADREIDAAGRVVVPGLIDAHFHAYAVSMDMAELEAISPTYLGLAAAQRLSSAVRRGFTTVRDVAGGDAGFSRALSEGLAVAPRYLYTGAALSQTGGHGDPRSAEQDGCVHGGRMSEVVDGVENVRRAVRDRLRTGAHAIKMMTSGGVISLTDPIRVPQYSAEEIAVAVAEAARRGSYVTAHAYSPEAIEHSIRNGIRSIEHGNLLDEPTAALMAEAGAFLVPTLAAYDALHQRGEQLGLLPVSQAKNLEVLEAGARAIEYAMAAGVQVGFGSDLMGDLEDNQLRGLRLQIDVIGVAELLRCVGPVNAALIRRPDLGVIAQDGAADLLMLDGNPFEDASVLWDETRPRTVISQGRVIA